MNVFLFQRLLSSDFGNYTKNTRETLPVFSKKLEKKNQPEQFITQVNCIKACLYEALFGSLQLWYQSVVYDLFGVMISD